MWLHRLVAASVQSTDTPEFAKTQGHNSSHMHMQGGEGPPVVACHTDPTTCDQLAYSRLIIREALRHGGVGWLNYDRAFRQQAAVDHLCGGTHWNIAPRTAGINDAGACHWPRALFCTLCRDIDHTRVQCALLCMHPPTTRTPTATSPVPRRRSNIYISWNRGA